MGPEVILGWLNPLSFLRAISSYLDRPRLEIYYASKETYHKAIDLSFNKTLGLFCHVMVRNKGKTTAKNCKGELRSIQQLNNKAFQNIEEYKNIMTLKWAHEKDYSPKDIDDVPRRLDVCYVHEGYDIVHFFTEKYPSGNQTDFPPGEYLIRIRVKSDNTSSIERSFIVKYKEGDFDSLRIEDYQV